MSKLVTMPPIVGNVKEIKTLTSANESSNPVVGSGQDFSGYSKVELEITLGGDTPSWDITPLLVNGAGNAYMEGETVTVTGAKTFVKEIDVNGNSDVNFRVDNSSGTSPTIIIKGRGLNK